MSRPAHLGGLGFTYKWNMGWMHDVIEYAQQDPIHRRWRHTLLTFSMLYTYSENFVLPFSHDEVVHGKRAMLDKMPGDPWQKHATLRTLYGFMMRTPRQEAAVHGERVRPNARMEHDRSLDWHLLDDPATRAAAVRAADQCVLQTEPALFETDYDGSGFRWIDCSDNENSVVSLMRSAHDPQDFILMVFNFTPVPRAEYRIGVPAPGFYNELMNSDAAIYGGSNMGNGGGRESEPVGAHGFPHSLRLTLPPLSCLLLKVR